VSLLRSRFVASLTVCLLLGAIPPTRGVAQQAAAVAAPPTVLIIGTGGTIAGAQAAPGTLGGYRAGALSAEEIIASVPELSRHARIESEQFSNVASTAITPAMWLALSKRINSVLRERADIAGVVVTHGTDRLEETAFFLYLTVRSDRPVVVVGAQRPANGISPDGPINLLSAVRTVVSPQATGKGVLVVMDDRILSARESRKLYQRSGGFSGGEMGMLGVVNNASVEFLFAPTRVHGAASEFDLTAIDSLPTVELTFCYPGGTGPVFSRKPDGIAVATNGCTPQESQVYTQLRREGVVVANVFAYGDNMSAVGSSSAVAFSGAPAGSAADTTRRPAAAPVAAAPSVTVQHLTPAKARILLMVALTRTRDPREIQRLFLRY
jgi:L-asparaginase